jgi:pantothenate kinase-related protein Tda10
MHKNKWALFFSLVMLIFTSLTAQATEEKPAWLQADVLKSALEINMTDEQKPQFQNAITTYLTAFQQSFKKIVSGRDTSGMERKIKRMNKRLSKKMDSKMAEFLSKEQMPKYEIYRDTLIKAMKP